MNWDALGAIGEVVGAIAVIATLAYLAVQIRQANKMARFYSLQATRDGRMSMFLSERDSPYIPAIRAKLSAGEELDAEESIRLSRHVAAMWAITYSEWVQIDMGMAGGYATDADGWLRTILAYPYVIEWWEEHGIPVYPEPFVAFVEGKRREFGAGDA